MCCLSNCSQKTCSAIPMCAPARGRQAGTHAGHAGRQACTHAPDTRLQLCLPLGSGCRAVAVRRVVSRARPQHVAAPAPSIGTRACTHARMHACTHARMHACTHARMHARTMNTSPRTRRICLLPSVPLRCRELGCRIAAGTRAKGHGTREGPWRRQIPALLHRSVPRVSRQHFAV
jgi:hypothetical protein